jgi:hypothetical protein
MQIIIDVYCFFSQAVYFHLTLDISFIGRAPTMYALKDKHMFVLTMQKRNPTALTRMQSSIYPATILVFTALPSSPIPP